MAADASLIFRIYADAKGVKTGVEQAKSELDKLKDSAAGVGNKLLSAFPPAFGNAVRGIGTSVSGLAGAFGGFGAILGGLGIAKITHEFLDTTSALSDLSLQTDITINNLQGLQHAGELVGVSLDEIVRGVGALDRQLGSGDKGATKALAELGLSLEKIIAMDPGQRFIDVGTAISKIPDPMKRAAIAQELFLKGGIGLMPLFRSNLKEAADAAFKLTDETVKAGDAFGDYLTVITNFGKAAVGNVILGPIAKGMQEIVRATQNATIEFQTMRGVITNMPQLPGAPRGFEQVGPPVPSISISEANKITDVLDKQTRASIKAKEEAIKLADTWKSEVKAISDAISGAPIVQDLKQWAEAMRAPGAVAKTLADSDLRDKLGKSLDVVTAKFGSLKAAGVGSLQPIHDAMKAMHETAETIPPSITEIFDGFEVAGETSRDWAAANAETTDSLLALIAAGARLPAVTDEQRRKFLETHEVTVTWRQSLEGLSRAMTDLAQTAGSSFVNAMASVVNAINVGTKAVSSFKQGLTDLTSGKGLTGILSGLTGIVGGIGGIVSAAQAAISIGKALFSVFDRDKGRDLVVAFAESLGGFDVLQKQLEGLGAEGDRLWKLLTQGKDVHGSPDAARRAIQEVQEALARFTKSTENDINALLDGVEERSITIPVHFAVDDLPAMGSGGIVRKPTLALIGESGPEAVVPLGSSVAGGSQPIVVQTYLDGRQIAESTVEHIPYVLGRRG